jgi:hypothetical protein
VSSTMYELNVLYRKLISFNFRVVCGVLVVNGVH